MDLDYNQVIVDIILVNYDFIHSQCYQHIEDNIQFTQRWDFYCVLIGEPILIWNLVAENRRILNVSNG